MTANRNVPLRKVGDIVGRSTNMILYRVGSKTDLQQFLYDLQDDFLTSIEHQCSLVRTVQPVRNSVMSLQCLDTQVRRQNADQGIYFEYIWRRSK